MDNVIKVLFGIWGFLFLISLTVTGGIIYLVYTVITQPELVNEWITKDSGG
jgi:hypothetical protein